MEVGRGWAGALAPAGYDAAPVNALPLLLAMFLRTADGSPRAAPPAPASTAPAKAEHGKDHAKANHAKADAPKGEPARASGAKAAAAKPPAPKGGRHTAAKPEPVPPPAAAASAAAAASVPPTDGNLPVSEEGRLLVEHKCAKCHDVSLSYSSELDDGSWRLHMKRMAARPGAAITDAQGRKIHEYLKSIAGQSAAR